LERTLHAPWLREDNLPRVRDLVSQSIRRVRGTLGGREEAWVNNPASALTYQNDPLFLSTQSHHAALLHLARVEWLLMDPAGPRFVSEVEGFLDVVAGIEAGTPAEAVARIDALLEPLGEGTEGAGKWIVPVGRRIRELAQDMAPGSLAGDLAEVAYLARDAIRIEPAAALAELDALRTHVANRAARRFVITGNRGDTDALMEPLGALLGAGDPAVSRSPSPAGDHRLVARRLFDHEPAGPVPVHYALVHGGGTSGVIVTRATAGGLDDLDDEALVPELAGLVFGGQGPHGFFMKTWGAGLAYSNGLGVSAQGERVRYYAERCPGLVETMKFVTGLVAASGAAPSTTRTWPSTR